MPSSVAYWPRSGPDPGGHPALEVFIHEIQTQVGKHIASHAVADDLTARAEAILTAQRQPLPWLVRVRDKCSFSVIFTSLVNALSSCYDTYEMALKKRSGRSTPHTVVRIQYRPGEDGWIIAECPDLPGCVSQGRTHAEARHNVRDAVAGWLLVHRDLGLPSPVSELLEVS